MVNSVSSSGLRVRYLGLRPYTDVWQAMSTFTNERTDDTPDELWVVEHHPVYTQGQAGKSEHILAGSDIPIVQSDRGGQVTYHGPGQLILYPLINLRRRSLGVRDMVTLIEQWVIQWLASHRIESYTKANAPGVYIDSNGNDAKIASLGLRVRRGCCFHGVSINIDMDTRPFDSINPCGYQGLKITQFKEQFLGLSGANREAGLPTKAVIIQELVHGFVDAMAITETIFIDESNDG